jgi:hypothetical protein
MGRLLRRLLARKRVLATVAGGAVGYVASWLSTCAGST